jgi:hypothetical protein
VRENLSDFPTSKSADKNPSFDFGIFAMGDYFKA